MNDSGVFHDARVEQHDYYEALQVTCTCGWRSGMFRDPARAEAAARVHQQNWAGTASTTGDRCLQEER